MNIDKFKEIVKEDEKKLFYANFIKVVDDWLGNKMTTKELAYFFIQGNAAKSLDYLLKHHEIDFQNRTENHASPPLIYAVKMLSSVEVVRVLIENGADINIRDGSITVLTYIDTIEILELLESYSEKMDEGLYDELMEKRLVVLIKDNKS